MHKLSIDMTGQKHGKLTILGPADKPQEAVSGGQYWHALCDCGREITVLGWTVRSGGVHSCGCLRTLYEQCRKHDLKYDKEYHHGQR